MTVFSSTNHDIVSDVHNVTLGTGLVWSTSPQADIHKSPWCGAQAHRLMYTSLLGYRDWCGAQTHRLMYTSLLGYRTGVEPKPIGIYIYIYIYIYI